MLFCSGVVARARQGSTALHEAAHLVAASCSKARYSYVLSYIRDEARNDSGDLREGRTTCRGPRSATPFENAIFYLAGPEAQRLFSPLDKFGCAGDIDQAEAAVRDTFTARMRARAFVRKHQYQIWLMAKQLQRRGWHAIDRDKGTRPSKMWGYL